MCPEYVTQCAVLTKDKDGTIISPIFFGIAETARCNAAVPLFTDTPVFEPINLTNFFSKLFTKFEPAPDAQL